MQQNVHHTFSNINAIQDYNVDDIITELKRVRDQLLSGMQSRFDNVICAIKEEKPLDTYAYQFLEKEVAEYHNAFLVAQNLKIEGTSKLRLNSGKDMRHQILALVKNCASYDYKIDPEQYKRSLSRKI